MGKAWKWLRTASEGYGIWQMLVALLGGSAILSWVALSFDIIAQQGWGAVVFAGIAMACLGTLAGSAFLAAWRYFRPLPVSSPRGADSGDSTPAVSPAAQAHLNLLKATLGGVLRNVEAQAPVLARVLSERALAVLKEVIFTQMTISTLNYLIRSLPPVEGREPTAEFHAKATAYLEILEKTDIDDVRRDHIKRALILAKEEADSLLRTAPPKLDGRTLLDYREWQIAVRQIGKVENTLKQMISAAELRLAMYRPEIDRQFPDSNAAGHNKDLL